MRFTRTISIIVPVFNEEKTVGLVLERLQKLKIEGWQKEIVVVDDGSKTQVKGYRDIKLLVHKTNEGKGQAIRTGLKHATGEVVVIQDADLEYNPEDIKKLVREYEKTGLAIFGSRNLRPRKKGYKIFVWGDILVTKLFNWLYKTNLTDLYTGYKLFPTKIFKNYKMKSKGFEVEIEIAKRIQELGMRIEEIAINYEPRSFREGKKLKIWDGIIAIINLIR